MKKITIILALLCVTAFAQQKGTFKDTRDGKTYKIAKIGTQTWIAENLDYSGKNDDIGACYGKEPKNCKKYGALYTWDEAIKVCPSGWHLPSQEEWQTLVDFAGSNKIAEQKLKVKGWDKPNCKYTTKETTGRGNVIVTEHNECSTDEFGFSAQPGGFGSGGNFFQHIDGQGWWWSSSENNSSNAYFWGIGCTSEFDCTITNDKSNLLSVRCLQD